jgi:hypothetical protein
MSFRMVRKLNWMHCAYELFCYSALKFIFNYQQFVIWDAMEGTVPLQECANVVMGGMEIQLDAQLV